VFLVICTDHLLVGCGGPASEEAERLGGFGSGFGSPDREHLACVGGDLDAVVREGEVADDGVVQVLGSRVVDADVVGRPAGAELGALGGELTDEAASFSATA
jgi:hypothetical protein